jgi:GGDEF domain-containing protein
MSLTPNDHDLRIDSPWNVGERSGLLVLVALIPAILVLDYVAGRHFSLHLFYLLPIALAAWNLGERTGIAIALAAGAAWAFVDIASRAPGESARAIAWGVFSTLALYLFVAHLVARHRHFVDGLRALARVDSETGALSRREFDRLLDSEVRRAKRYRRPLALVLFDFGEVRNEKRGHLPAAVRTITSLVRECDSVARLSARRFAILLVECKAPEPMLVVERVQENLVANLQLRRQDLATAVATYGGASRTSAASFLALADNHVNLAKGGVGTAQTHLD